MKGLWSVDGHVDSTGLMVDVNDKGSAAGNVR